MAGVVVLIVIIGIAGSGGSNDGQVASPGQSSSVTRSPARSAEKAAQSSQPAESAESSMPSEETKFIAVVQKGIDDGNAADNDLKVGLAMKRRDKAICELGSTRANNWTGTIKTLDSNGDGDGILMVELSDGIAVGTWNNALSDISDNTLIKSGKLLDRLSEMSEGDEVTFSGTFIKDSETCVENMGLTKSGKLLNPEFVFRFSDVTAS